MGCRLLLVLAATCLLFNIASSATDKVICYYGSWSYYRPGDGNFQVNDIDPFLCTHVVYTFLGINQDGTVRILDDNLEVRLDNLIKFVGLKKQNPKLKTLIAIGGWNEGSMSYSAVAADSSLRQNLIQSALQLVQKYNLDGFDLDWEYPGQRGGDWADKQNYAILIKEFREEWDKHGLLLTAAVAATSGSVDLSYDVPAMSKYLDFINVMAYDLHGSYDGVTGTNAPLYPSSIDVTSTQKSLTVDAAIRGWLQRGAAPEKIALGLGVYGRSYTLIDPSNVNVGARVSAGGNPGPYTQEGGMLGYNEICQNIQKEGWTKKWDDDTKTPYAYKGNQWVGYDDPESIAIKVNYAKSLNLGAIMIWSVETEDSKGLCGTKYPILKAINAALGNSNQGGDVKPEERTTESSKLDDEEAPPAVPEIPDENDSITVAPSPGNICTKEGLERDPSNCASFYYCVNDNGNIIGLKQQCNGGLVFDNVSKVCNYPELVQCEIH